MKIADFNRIYVEHDLKDCYIIASTFRSGSTFVAELLNNNNMPGLGDERFNIIGDQSHAELEPYVRKMFESFRGRAFATKLMWPHRNDVARIFGIDRNNSALFQDLFPNAKWIFVEREDIFAQAISMWRAKTSGRWHIYDTNTTPEPAIDYDFEAIDDCLWELSLHNRLWRDFFALSGIVPFTVNYEELLADVPATLSRLLDFLGHDVPDQVTHVPLLKQSDALSDAFRSRLMEDLFSIGR